VEANTGTERKKINIGLFVDCFFPYIDGVVNVVDNYAKNMDNIGKVYVFCPEPKTKNYNYNKPYEIVNCKALRIPVVKLNYPRPARDKAFLKRLDGICLDIIHIHTPFAMGKLGLKIAKERKIVSVATLHSQYKRDFKRFGKADFVVNRLLKTIMAVYNGADEVFALNEACKRTLYEYGYKGPCRVFQNGTDMTPIPDIDGRIQAINKEYGLAEVKNVFVFVGRLYKQKNNAFSLKALSILARRGFNDFKFIIVGEGEDGRRLKRLVKKLGLSDKVIFTGLVKDREKIGAFFARSDLFLFPSVYDSMSLVQIEAACYETPAVFLENANTASTVTHGINGYISPADAGAFADMIENAVSDKAALKTVGQNAKRDLYTTWAPLTSRVYDRYLELIQAKESNL